MQVLLSMVGDSAAAPAAVEGAILLLRGTRVMLDVDLARLYGVETKVPRGLTWR